MNTQTKSAKMGLFEELDNLLHDSNELLLSNELKGHLKRIVKNILFNKIIYIMHNTFYNIYHNIIL